MSPFFYSQCMRSGVIIKPRKKKRCQKDVQLSMFLHLYNISASNPPIAYIVLSRGIIPKIPALIEKSWGLLPWFWIRGFVGIGWPTTNFFQVSCGFGKRAQIIPNGLIRHGKKPKDGPDCLTNFIHFTIICLIHNF